MLKTIRCLIGLHRWWKTGDDTRRCTHCAKTQIRQWIRKDFEDENGTFLYKRKWKNV